MRLAPYLIVNIVIYTHAITQIF